LSIKVATCFDSRSLHQANYWTMFEVHQVKVHIFGIPKCLQQWEYVGTFEVDIYSILFIKIYIHVFLKFTSEYLVSKCGKYSNSKFSQNTTNLLSIKVATCFDSRSHHQANYWTMFEVHQVKVHIFGIPKCLQQWENVGTFEVDIYSIIYIKIYSHVFLKFTSEYLVSKCGKYSNSKFSQNTTNLLSIKVATSFDSRSHYQANYWTMFEVHQVKVHIFGIPKCLQQWENVCTFEVDIYNIIYIKIYSHVFLKFTSEYLVSKCGKYSNSKFSRNTTNLLPIKLATCFDSRSHHQTNYWTMFEAHQAKVHVFGVPKFSQQWENVGRNEVNIYNITYIKIYIHLFLKFTSEYLVSKCGK